MKFDWLNTRVGLDFVAIGCVATCVAAPLIVLQDVWFVSTGVPPTLLQYDRVLSFLAAGVAAVFSVCNFFVFRRGLPKYVTAILAISFASYVVQQLLPALSYWQAAVLCIARIVGCCTPLLLAWTYYLDLKAGRVAR